MLCPNCSFSNISGSIFCQECGNRLTASTPQPEPLHQAMEQIIFTPKKGSHAVRNVLVIVGLCIAAGSILIASIPPKPKSVTETSGNSPKDLDRTNFPLHFLSLTDASMEWIGPNLYIKGILRNDHTKTAHEISVRVDFFSDEASTKLFDTRFFKILEVPEKGAFSFSEMLLVRPENKFWWTAQVSGAKY